MRREGDETFTPTPFLVVPMPVFPISPPLPNDEAPVLLVLLPTVSAGDAAQAWTVTTAMLNLLQARLGAAIRVIRIDAASHPAVVRSFYGQDLPAFVLLKHGIEVWRQQGLPEGESIVAELLNKALPTSVQAPVAQA